MPHGGGSNADEPIGWEGEAGMEKSWQSRGPLEKGWFSKCYAPECPPYVHKPPNNWGTYTNLPRRGLHNPAWGKRSGAAAERRPR